MLYLYLSFASEIQFLDLHLSDILLEMSRNIQKADLDSMIYNSK